MTKHILTFILIIFGINLKSQSSAQISLGVKLVNVEKRKIDFWYIDESPSMDNISRHIDLKGDYSIDIGIRWTSRNSRVVNWLFGGQGYFGALGGLALEGGLIITGKNKNKSFRFEPEVNFVGGYCWKGIGEISNNDIYIQVNDTKFQDHTNVNVKMENWYVGIKPGLNISFKLKNNRYLGIRGSYQYSSRSSSIGFSGKDDSAKSTSDTESLSEPNVGFYVDGVISKRLPFNPDGLEIKLIYGF